MDIINKINVKSDIGKANLGMHITAYNSLSREDFKMGFRSEEVRDFALSPACSNFWNMIAEYATEGKNLIRSYKYDGVVDTPGTNPKPETVTPVATVTAPVFQKPQALTTNEGDFKSVEVLKANMGTLFPHIDEAHIGTIFDSAMSDLSLDLRIDYLNEPLFTALVKIAKLKCDDDVISALGGEVGNPVSKAAEPVQQEEQVMDDEAPCIKEFPYQMSTALGMSYFKSWKEALQGQKEYNKANKTKLKAVKRKVK